VRSTLTVYLGCRDAQFHLDADLSGTGATVRHRICGLSGGQLEFRPLRRSLLAHSGLHADLFGWCCAHDLNLERGCSIFWSHPPGVWALPRPQSSAFLGNDSRTTASHETCGSGCFRQLCFFYLPLVFTIFLPAVPGTPICPRRWHHHRGLHTLDRVLFRREMAVYEEEQENSGRGGEDRNTQPLEICHLSGSNGRTGDLALSHLLLRELKMSGRRQQLESPVGYLTALQIGEELVVKAALSLDMGTCRSLRYILVTKMG
jgi:hypothetical protein